MAFPIKGVDKMNGEREREIGAIERYNLNLKTQCLKLWLLLV